MENQCKPFLRWAGSKRKLLPELTSYWSNDFKRYVEPFSGSACLFFALKPKSALLNDTNKELINTYEVIKKRPLEVYKELQKIELGKENYYALRAILPAQLTPIQRAARFIFLNRYCFNGLYRTNAKGIFNVPYAPSRTGQLPSKEHLLAVSKSLYRKTVLSKDFEVILDKHTRPGDFVYLDPPYAVGNARIFRQYGPNSFGIEDIERLKQALRRIDSRGIKFVLSYAESPESLEAFQEWEVKRVYAQRNIAGFTKKRRKATELIFTNI